METNNTCRPFSSKLHHMLRRWKTNKNNHLQSVSSSNSQQSNGLHLSQLPLELLFQIHDLLDTKSQYILSSTSHYFYSVTVGKLYRSIDNINVLVTSYQYRYQLSGWQAAQIKINKFKDSILSSESFWFAVNTIEFQVYTKLIQFKQFLLNQEHCDKFFEDGRHNLKKLKCLKLVYLGGEKCNFDKLIQLNNLKRFSFNYQLPIDDYSFLNEWQVNKLTHLQLEVLDLPSRLIVLIANTFNNVKVLELKGNLVPDADFVALNYKFNSLVELHLNVTNLYFTNLKSCFPPQQKFPKLRSLSLSGKSEFSDYLLKSNWSNLKKLNFCLVYLPTNLELKSLFNLSHFHCDAPSHICDSLLPLVLSQLTNLQSLNLNGTFTDNAFLVVEPNSNLKFLQLNAGTNLAFQFLNFLYSLGNLKCFKIYGQGTLKFKKQDLKTTNDKLFKCLLRFELVGFPRFMDNFIKTNAPLLN